MDIGSTLGGTQPVLPSSGLGVRDYVFLRTGYQELASSGGSLLQ